MSTRRVFGAVAAAAVATLLTFRIALLSFLLRVALGAARWLATSVATATVAAATRGRIEILFDKLLTSQSNMKFGKILKEKNQKLRVTLSVSYESRCSCLKT